jgi:hypothetical protein
VSFRTIKSGIFRVDFPEEVFPSAWLGSSVPVLFDFQNIDPFSDPENIRRFLYCLFPVKIGNSAVVAEFTHNAFVNSVLSDEWAVRTASFIKDIVQVANENRQQLERQRTRSEQLHAFLKYSMHKRRRF